MILSIQAPGLWPDTILLTHCAIPCRPGMPCCCSHWCRVWVALQWLGVGQHSPTTSPATWIPEDSNHCRWKEDTVRSLGPHIFLSSFPIVRQGPYTSATLKDPVVPLTHQAPHAFVLYQQCCSPYETMNNRPSLITENELFLSFLFFYPKWKLQIPLL